MGEKDQEIMMKMKADEPDTRTEKPEDEVFFAPLDHIRNIENLIVNLEITHRELQKVAEGMKPVED